MGLEQNLVKPITLENGKIWEVITIILAGRQSKVHHQCEDTTVAVSRGVGPTASTSLTLNPGSLQHLDEEIPLI